MNEDLLQKQIEEQRNLLSTDRLDLSFGEIMRMYQDGDLIIRRPDFDPDFHWNIAQRTRFIESVLLGIPVSPIFVEASGDGVWKLINGVQRVMTLLSFVGVLNPLDGFDSDEYGLVSVPNTAHNNWYLSKGDKLSALEGFTYKTMPELFKRNFRRVTCRVITLNWRGYPNGIISFFENTD
jgi:Protein of unknown function DUF262